MKFLILFFVTIVSVNSQSSSFAAQPSTSFSKAPTPPSSSVSKAPTQPSTSVSKAPTPRSTSVSKAPTPRSTSVSKAPTPSSTSASKAPGPSTSVAPTSSSRVAPSSKSSRIAPSASSSVHPASSSKVPTLPPTTTTTTTPKPIHYNLDVTLVEANTSTPCIWFKANMNVTYKTNAKNATQKTIMFDDKSLKKTGKCSDLAKKDDTSILALAWLGYDLTVIFKTKSDGGWYVSEFGFDISPEGEEILTAEKTFGPDENSEFLRSEKNYAYQCAQLESIPLSSDNGTFSITLEDIWIQPFTGNMTKNVDTCSSKSSSSTSSSIVPIAVGCALAGLIVIVLIAYLIGRRKNDGRGYQQV